jgi:type II secretory pathway pseudopilin PulG
MKRWQSTPRRRGQTLVGILIVLVILLALAAYFFYFRAPKKGGPPEAIPKAAMNRAHDVECQNNLQQIRAAIQMAQMDGANPPDLPSLNLGENFLKCPVGGEPYRYDPQTAQVGCAHPGHEKF